MHWLDSTEDRFFMQDVCAHAQRFLAVCVCVTASALPLRQMGSAASSRVGAQILLQLVDEMDQPDSVPGMAKHRKAWLWTLLRR